MSHQLNTNPVAEETSAAQPTEQLLYASIHLTPGDPIYSNIRPVKLHIHTGEEDEDSVEYTVIKPDQITVAPR